MIELRDKIFKHIFLYSVLLCILTLFVGLGCSKGLLRKSVDPGKEWACDKDADEAITQNDLAAGISLHERFLERFPENALALYHLGYAYGQTGYHIKEVSYYEKAIALGFKKNQIFFNLGMAYGELDQEEKSIYAFKQAVKINPDSADNHFGLALAYHRNVKDKPAEREFLKAIEIDPKHVEARLSLGLLYSDWGELQKAAEQLRKILEIDPTNTRARKFLESVERE